VAEYDIFLSHYSGDDALARSLERALTAAGISVWYDGAEIKLGDSILAKMQEGIQRSRYGLILFTPGLPVVDDRLSLGRSRGVLG
jgi:predicted nucleotide-binding protein